MQVQEGPIQYVSVIPENITLMVQEAHLTDNFNAKHCLENMVWSKEREKHALTSVHTAPGLMQYTNYFLKWTVFNLEMKSHTNSG
jgi:hypothetical protein